ncbi:hypothetical protein A3L04_08440 [Thermococcus chitonophagus]|uniref:Uncharacterized protein n=1 Tax=Thermococcus chitonophagus TaxID=54262 RepID=A0A160VT87_9EURY|nr:hypothetical protein [Thermococcus chitonophagus]ASJ17093.1 hypothetical protein A3L04_08440 [Thermococcus chitonophagus]CUX77696.1 hypothetical protein CHITON_0917 [Thermococcus chitonophagus]
MSRKFREFDMYPYVREILRRRFPASKGWIIKERERRNGYEPDYIVERRRANKIERHIFEVKREPKAREEHVRQVNRYARYLSGPNVEIKSKNLIYPAGADVSDLPPDIRALKLRKFKVMDRSSKSKKKSQKKKSQKGHTPRRNSAKRRRNWNAIL